MALALCRSPRSYERISAATALESSSDREMLRSGEVTLCEAFGEAATKLFVVNLEILHTAAQRATESVPLQNVAAESKVGF